MGFDLLVPVLESVMNKLVCISAFFPVFTLLLFHLWIPYGFQLLHLIAQAQQPSVAMFKNELHNLHGSNLQLLFTAASGLLKPMQQTI